MTINKGVPDLTIKALPLDMDTHGPGVAVTVLPFKQSFHPLIIEVSDALQPQLQGIYQCWRQRMSAEMTLEPRAIATLQRTTPGSGFHFFQRGQFPEFFENLTYFGTRLSKLQVD